LKNSKASSATLRVICLAVTSLSMHSVTSAIYAASRAGALAAAFAALAAALFAAAAFCHRAFAALRAS
jgi:hypothetical protein